MEVDCDRVTVPVFPFAGRVPRLELKKAFRVNKRCPVRTKVFGNDTLKVVHDASNGDDLMKSNDRVALDEIFCRAISCTRDGA